MKQASTNTIKWLRKETGAYAPITQNSTAATPNITAIRLPEAGAVGAPWPCALGAGTAAAGLAACAGAAGNLGAGGGQVTSPFLMTVSPRMASSSMLTLILPSLVL